MQGRSFDRFKKIPFSGRWYEYRQDATDSQYVSKSEWPFPFSWCLQAVPHEEDKEAYKHLLTTILGSPKDLIQRHQKKQKRTIILDYVARGEAIASFVAILKEWLCDGKVEEQESREAILFLLFKSVCPKRNLEKACFPFRYEADYCGDGINDVLEELTNAEQDVRLVPHYPFKKWRLQDPKHFIPPRKAQLCLFELTKQILKRQKGIVMMDEKLHTVLDSLHISYKIFNHEPLFTVEQARATRKHIPAGHAKNLFLKDSKKQIWLFIAHADTMVPLKKVAKRLQAPELRFAHSELLLQYLGVMPGAVTPLGLINDLDHVVRVVIDKKLLDCDAIGFHPLRNDATITISPQDLQTFIRSCGNECMIFDFDAVGDL